MNFYTISVTNGKNNTIEIAPDFQAEDQDSDLMIRGKSFYAVWNDEKGLWSENEYDVRRIVDRDLMKKRDELQQQMGDARFVVKRMLNYSSKSWDNYCNYIHKMPDRFVPLDDKLTFADTPVRKEDYVSKRLPYSVKAGSHESYDEIMNTLYSQENREKLEWAIGSILTGDSRKIQKFIVLYGKGGTGKGTVLEIISRLFKGYVATFRSKDLGDQNKQFSMEPFKTNPMVAIDGDGDLSRMDDSTRINKIVAHERLLMNEKNKPQYSYIPHCFLFIGSNEPVKIKDAESGMIRRLIDVEPTGTRIPARKYNLLMERIDFELGAIAEHCLKVYRQLGGRHAFDNYRPKSMMYRTDVFLNYIDYWYDEFLQEDGISLNNAYAKWKEYCDKCGIESKSKPHHIFREELKNYFREFRDVTRVNGRQVRSWYSGFIKDCLSQNGHDIPPDEEEPGLKLTETFSRLDDILKDCKAQYAATDRKGEPPAKAWSKVTTHLSDLNTTLLHYILGPEWMVMVDFDLKNEKGEKDAKLNLEAASKWPPTYAEFSKGGEGVHLYYRYTGDLDALKALYAPDIEVKIFRGKSAIRRRLSYCNDREIATISSGLPVKEKKSMVSEKVIKDERHLINLIMKAMRSVEKDCTDPIPGCEHHVTACNFIKDILDQAYESGIHYDVSSLHKTIRNFGMASTNSKKRCADVIRAMKWKSEEAQQPVEGKRKGTIVFYDCEVFPNVNMVNWKIAGPDHPVVRMINPKPQEIEELLEFDLIGFNCRRYDNHILHAMRLGYKPEQVYDISKRIIGGSDNAFFSEAWDYSYTDIFDFSSEKKSLKKFEIELGIHHKELGMNWIEPVPEDRWEEVAEYCDNDVLATEALFYSPKRQADWTARQILAEIAGMNVNSTTNSLTTRIIFGDDRKPQSQFNYRDMGDVSQIDESFPIPKIDELGLDPEYTKFDSKGRPIFPGYLYERMTDPETGKKTGPYISTYRGEEVGEGGYVYAEDGIHVNVALDDVESMHPSSAEDEELFGKYTSRFSDIKRIRVLIKHKAYDEAKKLFDGKLTKYLDNEEMADALSGALKIAINSVYGLTSAKFDNPFRDPRNKDNIVAKRGALFMVNLKHEVQRRGYTVAHIKTDSIKIPNADNKILAFVSEYGKLYGYKFDHEATYERMCLVNDAVYIARGDSIENCEARYGYIPSKQKKIAGKWTATGTQFQVPYVFKSLFTKEPITLQDMTETKSVTSALYLDFNENLSEGDHNYMFVGKCGAFCPVLPGTNGGELCREKDGKYNAATGSKGYRWKEYEVVRDLGLEGEVDRGYYEALCQKAKDEIGRFGPYELFVSNEPLPPF